MNAKRITQIRVAVAFLKVFIAKTVGLTAIRISFTSGTNNQKNMLEKLKNKWANLRPWLLVRVGDCEFYGEFSRVWLLFGCIYIASSRLRSLVVVEFTKPVWLGG